MDDRGARFRRWVRRCVWLVSCVLLAPCAVAEVSDIQLRLVVEHPTATEWTGRLRLSGGQLSELRRLDSDRTNSPPLLLDATSVAFRHEPNEQPVQFDVRANTDLNGAVLVELALPGAPQPATLTIPLMDVLTGEVQKTIPGSEFVVKLARTPGDALRVRFANQHLVFAPGETWTIDAIPHLPPLESDANAKLELKVFAARSRRVLWRSAQPLEPDGNGKLKAAERIEIPIPADEGAYDLVLTLSRDGLRQLLKTGSPSVERSIQFAVVGPQPPAAPDELRWRDILEFDTSEPQWWERLARFPAWRDLPGSFRQLFGENFGKPFFQSGRKLNRIEGEGWLALPLPVIHPERAHRLEIEYPQEMEQTMAVTIVERDPTGTFFSPSVQTGFHVDPSQAQTETGVQSVMFWPRTRLAYLVLSNKNADRPVEFGRVRVQESNGSPAGTARNAIGQRRSLAHFADPDLTRPFAGTRTIDPLLDRSFTDWETFLATGRHMVEYLNHAGLSGAAINVLSDAGQLAPHPMVDGGTQVDSGQLFTSGQDAIPKDVLECYFRLFDREQLQLIPTIRLNMIVPQLEAAGAIPSSSTGVWLMDAEGQLSAANSKSSTPRYNVLDPRVQSSILQIVQEIIERYAHHEAFGGIAIELDERSFACLPNWDWGYDPTTIGRYLATDRARQIDPPVRSARDLIDGPAAEPWHEYRVEQVTELYRRLAANLQRQRPDSTLYLLTADLVRSEGARRALGVSQSRREALNSHLTAMGIDLQRLAAIRGLVAVRPLASAFGGSLVAERAQIEMSNSPVAAQVFEADAAQITKAPMTVVLPSLQDGRRQEMPIIPQRIQSEVQPTSVNQLRCLARSLADTDVRTVFLTQREPANNVETLARWSRVFRRLPAQPFTDALQDQQSVGPLTVRTLSRAQESLVYVVNRSPWPVRASIFVQLPPHTRLESLAIGPQADEIRLEGGNWVWTTQIAPFAMQAVTTSARQIVVGKVDYRLPSDLQGRLQQAISALASQAALTGEPRRYDRLSNAQFRHAASE